MIAARKEADIKYQAFLDNDKVDVNFAKLEYVYKSYISLLDRIESISKLMGERQFLTELHFIGPIFPLNAHEKYHEISDRIQKEVSDFFKDSKIFLNDFTRFYLSEIGKDDKRGITPKSFGSCLNSVLKNFETLPGHSSFVYRSFIRYGRQIDATICHYRDKFISMLSRFSRAASVSPMAASWPSLSWPSGSKSAGRSALVNLW